MKRFRIVVIILCSAVLLCSGTYLGIYYFRQYREAQTDKLVQSLVADTPAPLPTLTPTPLLTPEPTPTPTPEPTPTPAPVVMDKYASLVEENPDTIGWLKIDGTAIDYVVMHTPDDPDKYLHIDFYGNQSNRGTLYLDAKNDIWDSENLIIYGHHMQSSAMFGNLDYFASKDYWKDHRYIQFDTIYEEQTYEIIGAFYARILNKSEEGFRYYYFREAETEEEFQEYMDFIRENRCYDTGVTAEFGDQLLTLSTCAYHVENGRFAVVAKKVVSESAPEAALPVG